MGGPVESGPKVHDRVTNDPFTLNSLIAPVSLVTMNKTMSCTSRVPLWFVTVIFIESDDVGPL